MATVSDYILFQIFSNANQGYYKCLLEQEIEEILSTISKTAKLQRLEVKQNKTIFYYAIYVQTFFIEKIIIKIEIKKEKNCYSLSFRKYFENF